MTKEVYSVKITLQVTDKMFRNPFLIPMDTLYALIAKLGFIVFCWTLFHEPGFARPVRHLGQVEGQSDHEDDVTLPYMGTCLIT